jgi:hypothetical protein
MHFALNPLAAVPFNGWLRVMRTPGTVAARRITCAVQGPMTIDKGATLVIERASGASGASVACVSGSLWITHDGDVKDIFIEAGDTYRSDRASRMLVHGLAASLALVA